MIDEDNSFSGGDVGSGGRHPVLAHNSAVEPESVRWPQTLSELIRANLELNHEHAKSEPISACTLQSQRNLNEVE